jgi:hypothetical protein
MPARWLAAASDEALPREPALEHDRRGAEARED